MLLNEKTEFNKMLYKLFAVYLKKPDQEVYEMWFKIMAEYDLKVINVAFLSYAKNEHYPPVPASVISRIPKPKEISADEAWAHVPKLDHEGQWLNQRMSNALGQIAGMNDVFAARKSFISAYNNLPDDNNWFYSPATGIDYEQQQETKQFTRKKLEAKQWIEKTKDEKNLYLTKTGLDETQRKLNKQRVSLLLSTINHQVTKETR